MGWSGHGNYDGDGTQTCHYDFLRWAKVYKTNDEIMDSGVLQYRGTRLPKEKRALLVKNLDSVVKKMPKKIISSSYSNEDRSIEWQMLLSLLVDNKIKPNKKIMSMAKEASEYLCSNEHAGEFCNPSARRRAIRSLLERAKKLTLKQ